VSTLEISFTQQRVKRQHLNLLIQGAAVDEAMSNTPQQLHHSDPAMARLNDTIGLAMQLSQFESRSFALLGRGSGDAQYFWADVESHKHPFSGSRLLTIHGQDLAQRGHERVNRRAQDLDLAHWRNGKHMDVTLDEIRQLHRLEATRRPELEALAVSHVAANWRIPSNRLSATLMTKNRPGLMLPGQQRPTGLRARLNSYCAVGWSRLVFTDDHPRVEAASLVSPLLRHELAKGIAELSCSHGLASLDDRMYAAVIAAAERIELERFAMQTGHELFLQWQSCLPRGVTTATALMYLSLAEPDVVEAVLTAAIEDRNAACQIMTHLCQH